MQYFAKDPQVLEHVLKRLKRIEGQTRGLQQMLITGRDCEEVLIQLHAIRAALNKVAVTLVTENLEACLKLSSDAERQSGIKRARRAFLHLM